MIYIDTNIFLYRTNRKSSYHKATKKLIDSAARGEFQITTSTEVIQEIIHVTKKLKALLTGIKTAKLVMQQIEAILSIDREVISRYLDLAKKYKEASSRDLIHVACCSVNKIDIMVTVDRDFKKFKEIKALTPEEYLKSKV